MPIFLNYKNIKIHYADQGQGESVVLLHGFLEDSSMWKDIIPKLIKNHRVITIDLLGHGQTGCLGEVHTMEDMAYPVAFVLNHLKIDRASFFGHSMGGYVALAYAEENPHLVKGLCLMNSTYEADDKDRKHLRARANEMIRDNFKNMVRMSFANLFSAESKVKYKPEFEAALKIALSTSVEGYIAANEGMRLRKDRSLFFAKAPFIKTLILGKKDVVLNYELMVSFAKKHDMSVHVFSEGHMSYIENKTELLKAMMHFIEKI